MIAGELDDHTIFKLNLVHRLDTVEIELGDFTLDVAFVQNQRLDGRLDPGAIFHLTQRLFGHAMLLEEFAHDQHTFGRLDGGVE